MRRWDRLVEQYMEEYVARGVCEETAAAVQRELDRWGTWLKHRRPRPSLEAVNSDLVIRYVQGRTAFRAKATVSSTMSVMRGMGDFLVRQGVWGMNPLRWLHGPKLDGRSRLPRRIGQEAMKTLWEAAAKARQGYHRSLWLAALGLLYGTGLRRGELERLNVGDWQRDEGLLCVDGRKTGRERRVAVPELAWRCVEAYLPERQNHLERLGRREETALLVNKWGERLAGLSISNGIQSLARRAGLTRITLHQFRHTCASDLLEGGAHTAEVKRILGHQTIQTTMRYLHIADPERHEAVRRHPINEFLAEGATP